MVCTENGDYEHCSPAVRLQAWGLPPQAQGQPASEDPWGRALLELLPQPHRQAPPEGQAPAEEQPAAGPHGLQPCPNTWLTSWFIPARGVVVLKV